MKVLNLKKLICFHKESLYTINILGNFYCLNVKKGDIWSERSLRSYRDTRKIQVKYK